MRPRRSLGALRLAQLARPQPACNSRPLPNWLSSPSLIQSRPVSPLRTWPAPPRRALSGAPNKVARRKCGGRAAGGLRKQCWTWLRVSERADGPSSAGLGVHLALGRVQKNGAAQRGNCLLWLRFGWSRVGRWAFVGGLNLALLCCGLRAGVWHLAFGAASLAPQVCRLAARQLRTASSKPQAPASGG